MQGSRQFKAFDDYLITKAEFQKIPQGELPVAINPDYLSYHNQRLALLAEQLKTTNKLAKADNLPDATITSSGLKSPH